MTADRPSPPVVSPDTGREALAAAILRHLFREPLADDVIHCLCGTDIPPLDELQDWVAYAEHVADVVAAALRALQEAADALRYISSPTMALPGGPVCSCQGIRLGVMPNAAP